MTTRETREIYFYDTAWPSGTAPVNLSDNVYPDEYPQISGGQVVWQGSDAQGRGVFLATLADTNHAPVAEAGGPYTGTEGSPTTLDASASSDLDGDALTCAWDSDNDGGYDDASGVTCTVTFPDDGTYDIGLQVTDEHGVSASDTAQVTVNNVAPSVNAGADATLEKTGGGMAFSQDGSFTESRS